MLHERCGCKLERVPRNRQLRYTAFWLKLFLNGGYLPSTTRQKAVGGGSLTCFCIEACFVRHLGDGTDNHTDDSFNPFHQINQRRG